MLGQHLAKTLDEIGVDRSHSHIVHADNAATKYQVIDGERVWGGTNPRPISPLQMAIRFMLPFYGLSDEDMAYIKTFDAAHLCNTAHMDEYLPQLKAMGIVVSYDYSNDHLKPGLMEKVAPYVDISLFSASKMTGTEMMEGLVKAHTLGTRIAIATNGGEGATLYDGNRFYMQKPDLCDAVGHHGRRRRVHFRFPCRLCRISGAAGPHGTAAGGKNPPCAGLCVFLGGESLHDARCVRARLQNCQ